MREIFHESDSPLSITIAADPRINSTDYTDDQIWELTINTGEPQSLAVQTTYGLRASSMRLFPRFSIGADESTNPLKFAKEPTFQKVYPNFIRISYAPFTSIEVEADYWVPNSHVLAGRIQLANTSSQNQLVKFELVVQLNPSEGGSRIIPSEIDGVQILNGSSENLEPVVFITGGASTTSSPYPALIHVVELPPGNSRQFLWAQSARRSASESFALAREITFSNWEAEIAKIELQNSSLIEVYTGDQEWDRAFLLAQKNAHGLLLSKSDHLQNLSYVTTRGPDDGYSLRGDGSDYSPQWSGQTPIDSYYLTNLLLPAAPELMESIFRNHLDSVNENGELDWKPGLGGQMGNRLATPILASIAWKIYQINKDNDFLADIYPGLVDFFLSWFSVEHDRDQDGVPEWDHPLQAGFEDHPIFARWYEWAQGLDISTAESPSLCAFLFREYEKISKMSEVLGIERESKRMDNISKKLRTAIDEAWNEKVSGYTYWDRENHVSSEKVILAQKKGSGSIELNQSFSKPQRIVFQIKSTQETTRKPQLIIHGHNAAGKHRIEIIPPEVLLWFPGWGTATSEQTYQSIETIEIKGLDNSDHVTISNAGLLSQDITTLLPIWARALTKERAGKLVENNIMNPGQFWKRFGLPACPDSELFTDNRTCMHVYLPWCLFIAEGMLAYGFRDETAELITNLMDGINRSLREDGGFREFFNAENGEGYGDIDALRGLAPLGLFLETLGLEIISPVKIRLSGKNPFPWPVTVKFRGMTVLRGLEKTQIIFPDGQTTLIDEPEPCLVTIE